MSDAFSVMTSLGYEALQAVRSAILIVDARADDLPIVYMNPAFESLTGYEESEVLGRNCRFLQGPRTDRASVLRIRTALKAREPVHEVIHNYRKDGTLFLNELFINPIRNSEGVTTHFVGCQNEVSPQSLASLQSEARERFETLSAREQQVFDGLVRGESVKEIAQQQRLSPRTIEKYRYRMQSKMGHGSLTMLVRYAIALGMEFGDRRAP
jgi:PAS domain S-box-containing protein